MPDGAGRAGGRARGWASGSAGEDAEAIAAIGRVGFPEVHSPHVPDLIVEAAVDQMYDIDRLRDCIAACAANPARELLVALSGSRVVGFVQFEADREDPELMGCTSTAPTVATVSARG